jgi:anti-sigma-K factor RskA
VNYLHPERLDRLAREYALGTLSGRARRRFERVLAESPAAVRAVAQWQSRLAVLSASLPPMPPRASVFPAIEQRLFGAPALVTAPARVGWLRQLFSARVVGGVLAGVLFSSVLLRMQPGLVGLEPRTNTLPASYVGLLEDAQGKPVLLASSRRHGKVFTVKVLQPLAVPAGRVAQLWAVPKGGAPAFPLVVVPASGSASFELSDTSEKLFANVPRLALSFEPAAARAGDQPTAAFVAQGNCVKLW